ncbi:MAG: TonB-dependent receptor [Cyclobacteriaceae bacterium]
MISKIAKVTCLALAAGALSTSLSYGQTQDGDLYDLSLEELMNIPIESASKQKETVFDAPVSSYSITREEIAHSGVTSIPEALRLCPGVIVRETVNGSYDIHLRGFDNLQRVADFYEQSNTITLVMIDNRPVFNYNQGGTFWEVLPVDLIDVERIEVVRGPSAPLFGPNAVSGVINIITKRGESEKVRLSANAMYGAETSVINVSGGKKLTEALSLTLSANYQNRERLDDSYYVPSQDAFIEDPEVYPFLQGAYPDTELAQEKYGVNLYLDYEPADNKSFSVSAGLQDSEVQKAYIAPVLPLTYNTTSSQYINLVGKFNGLTGNLSHTMGMEHVSHGYPGLITQYDYDVTNLVLEYGYDLGEKLRVTPSVNYQRASYDDSDYIDSDLNNGLLNGDETISLIAGSFRADANITAGLRLIGAVRADKFNTHDDLSLSYQFATTYKPTEDLMLRAVYSRSNSGAFHGNNFLDATLVQPDRALTVRGSENLDLTSNTMMEIGVRSQLARFLQADLALFHQTLDNVQTIITTGVDMSNPAYPVISQEYRTLPLRGIQKGATLSLNFVPASYLQVKPFVTFQQTDVEDLPEEMTLMAPTSDEKHEQTPSVYGGLIANITPVSRLNVNLNTYFMGAQTIYYEGYDPTSGMNNLDSKMLLNAKVSYNVWDKLNLYVNMRNFMNHDSREHYGTDHTAASYLFGASYNW